MPCIVQKFGGTSVATLSRIKNVAEIIAKSRNVHHGNIVAVVSAMAGVTNKFIECANDLNAFEGDPEYDAVVSSGELVTSGLLAIALKNVGIESRSYASWQVPVFSNGNHGCAEITHVNPENLLRDLENGIVPVVCGFQGIAPSNQVTTFGRGGSDLTAVAVSAAIKANLCEIYSDVDGVYTTDPNVYAHAKRVERLSYREMLEMSSQGAKVLQEQSVAYAMKKDVVVRVVSSFVDSGGTIVSSESSGAPFCGVAVAHNISQITVSYRNNGNFNDLHNFLENNNVNAEISLSEEGFNANVMVSKNQTASAIQILTQLSFVTNVKQEIARQHLSRISIIGASVDEKVRKDLEKELKKHNICLFGCLSKEYRANIVVSSNQLLSAISILHKYCGLDK